MPSLEGAFDEREEVLLGLDPRHVLGAHRETVLSRDRLVAWQALGEKLGEDPTGEVVGIDERDVLDPALAHVVLELSIKELLAVEERFRRSYRSLLEPVDIRLRRADVEDDRV